MTDSRPTRTLRRRHASSTGAAKEVTSFGTDDEGSTTSTKRLPKKRSSAPGSGISGGWDAGQQAMDSTSSFAQNLTLTDHVQIIKFRDGEPYATYLRHWVDTPQGKRTHTCLQTRGIDKDCPLCDAGVKQQAVAAFNVVVCNDDGSLTQKSWDVGPRLFNTFKSFHSDPKIGPLTKGFFAVSKTGKKGNADTHVLPVRPSSLEEEWDIAIPDDDEIDMLEKYDSSIVQITDVETLEELALTQDVVGD